MNRDLLAVTLGDPYSVTIECLGTLFAQGESLRVGAGIPKLIVGASWQWKWQMERLGLSLPSMKVISSLEVVPREPGFYFFDIDPVGDFSRDPSQLGETSRGELAKRALRAVTSVDNVQNLAVLTAPIQKSAMEKVQFGFPGQTEYFADQWGGESLMILGGPRLTVGLVTNHIPIAQVSERLSVDLIIRKIELFCRYFKETRKVPHPRIAVTGLNPHCSDHGLFGSEEAELIEPAISRSRQVIGSEASVEGPLPADTVFFRALNQEFDGVLAMYHDQGLGPLKTVHFFDAINITSGLKHLRVSPDHGPASDLFLRRRANYRSFELAYNLCVEYLRSCR